MSDDTPKKSCDSCRFWKIGDQSSGNVQNHGNCVWMMVGEEEKYNRATHIPFWANRMIFQTTSWQGDFCPVWEQLTNNHPRRRLDHE